MKLSQICRSESTRIGRDVRIGFQTFKPEWARKRKLQLRLIQYVQQDDIMTAMPKMFESGQQGGDMIEKVAEYDHDAASSQPLSKFVENRSSGGLRRRSHGF